MNIFQKRFELLSIMMLLICSMTLISCGDDDNELSGYYIWDDAFNMIEEGYNNDGESGISSAYCYHFVNGNTVEIITFSITENSNRSFYQNTYRGHTYYFNETQRKTYTYVIKDGKVYVTSGAIFTINGKDIIEDGGDRLVKFA